MNQYSQHVLTRMAEGRDISDAIVNDIVYPILTAHGLPAHVLNSTVPRISFGMDFKNFTYLIKDPNNYGPSIVDTTIAQYLHTGVLTDKHYTLNAFINNTYDKRLLSYGLIYLPDLVPNIVNYGECRVNERTGQVFMVLSFAHPSIINKIRMWVS